MAQLQARDMTIDLSGITFFNSWLITIRCGPFKLSRRVNEIDLRARGLTLYMG